MRSEMQKRIITSILLFSLLILMFYYIYVLIISLVIIAVVSWIEFYSLICKIFKKNNRKDFLLRFLCKAISLLYILLLLYLIITIQSVNPILNIVIIYSILVSVLSDIGGLVVGRIFKGKKLTKISPKKTISGAIGSFMFALLLIPYFIKYFINYSILELCLITLGISLISQVGDLFISYLKRKAKVKDTSDLLPGHGGVLDRIDGIIFSIPFGFLLFINI